MNGQFLMNKAITVQYAFKKDGKGERHGTPAERLLAAQARKNNALPVAARPPPAPMGAMGAFGARPPMAGFQGPYQGQFAGALAAAPPPPAGFTPQQTIMPQGLPQGMPPMPPPPMQGMPPPQGVPMGMPPPPPGVPVYNPQGGFVPPPPPPGYMPQGMPGMMPPPMMPQGGMPPPPQYMQQM